MISFDPDLAFDSQSVDKIIDALDNIPKLGMLSMRYVNNQCNPERNIWFSPRKFYGKNNQIYKITQPVFANIPGGFGIGVRVVSLLKL